MRRRMEEGEIVRLSSQDVQILGNLNDIFHQLKKERDGKVVRKKWTGYKFEPNYVKKDNS